jgi:hypothetical protein
MRTCATCKHWIFDDGERSESMKALNLGVCDAIPMFFDATTWGPDGPRVLKPEFAKMTAFTQDGSDYKAYLYTTKDHGCTLHEPMLD